MRSHTILITCFLGFTMAMTMVSNASAKRGACREDVKAFCSDVQRGDRGAMHQCLVEHEDELSNACKAGMEAHRQSAQACAADVQNFCPDITRGDRRAASQCLSEHESELSDTCRAAFEERGGPKGG